MRVEVLLYAFFNLGAARGWVVNTTPSSLYARQRPGSHYKGGWLGSMADLDGCENPRPHRSSKLESFSP